MRRSQGAAYSTGEPLALSPPEVDLWLGSAASRKAFLGAPLRAYRFIHIACHGNINEHNPGLSSLVLSPAEGDSGVMKLVDAMTLRLGADVLTLSGCKTAWCGFGCGNTRIGARTCASP